VSQSNASAIFSCRVNSFPFRAVDKLNNRPKKCLNYKTPYEAFEELTGVDIKNLLGYALMT
jgi:hypothetical protein